MECTSADIGPDLQDLGRPGPFQGRREDGSQTHSTGRQRPRLPIPELVSASKWAHGSLQTSEKVSRRATLLFFSI